MGICAGKDHSHKSSQIKYKSTKSSSSMEKKLPKTHDNKSVDILKDKELNEIYRDLPEWEGERYRGVGIKRMKGYKCELPINELVKLRDEFWTAKSKINPVYKQLKQVCIMDDGKNINRYLLFFHRF
jgi:hypothetical protein